MSSPTYPRGGDLQMLDDKFPTPGDNFQVTNPLLFCIIYPMNHCQAWLFILQMPLAWGRVWVTNPLQTSTRCPAWG